MTELHPLVAAHLAAMQDQRDDTTTKGAWAELIACAWLMEQGYEVFHKVSPSGWADVIAWRGQELIKADVRMCDPGGRAGGLSDCQYQSGVVPLFVTKEGVCSFSFKELSTMYKVLAESAGMR